MKNVVGAALLTALAAASVVPASAAVFNITPASHADGVVTNINAAAKTVTIDGQTYVVRSPLDLLDVPKGDEVALTYTLENGKRVLQSIDARVEGTDEFVD